LKVARASAPPGLEIKELFDQSVFVSASVDSVLREGAIAAGLTALMILLFLGSWRSTLVVMTRRAADEWPSGLAEEFSSCNNGYRAQSSAPL
jgi:hypothetical protein